MKHTNPHENVKIALTVFSLFGVPKHFLDLGCGDGVVVATASRLGSLATGIDLNPPPNRINMLTHDLTEPLDLDQKFEMIYCVEVAEHLPESAAVTLAQTIARHKTDHNTRLVFSAAQPGQGGENHLTLKSPYWWRNLLWEYGRWSYHDEATATLRLLLSYTAGAAAHWLVPNIQVF